MGLVPPREPLTENPEGVQDISPGSSAKRDHPGYAIQNNSTLDSRECGTRERPKKRARFRIGP
jgi:hypothetical protein